VTVTGRTGALTAETFRHLRDRTVLANVGHFATEIDVRRASRRSRRATAAEDDVEEARAPGRTGRLPPRSRRDAQPRRAASPDSDHGSRASRSRRTRWPRSQPNHLRSCPGTTACRSGSTRLLRRRHSRPCRRSRSISLAACPSPSSSSSRCPRARGTSTSSTRSSARSCSTGVCSRRWRTRRTTASSRARSARTATRSTRSCSSASRRSRAAGSAAASSACSTWPTRRAGREDPLRPAQGPGLDAHRRRPRHPAELRNEIEHFFQVYKDLEEEKVETRGYGNPRGRHWRSSRAHGTRPTVTIVFGAIAPHGDPAFVEQSPTRLAFEELGRRLERAEPDVTVVFTPHNVHVEGAFAARHVLDARRRVGRASDRARVPGGPGARRGRPGLAARGRTTRRGCQLRLERRVARRHAAGLGTLIPLWFLGGRGRGAASCRRGLARSRSATGRPRPRRHSDRAGVLREASAIVARRSRSRARS
jgi:hypothetical protein